VHRCFAAKAAARKDSRHVSVWGFRLWHVIKTAIRMAENPNDAEGESSTKAHDEILAVRRRYERSICFYLSTTGRDSYSDRVDGHKRLLKSQNTLG